jgi:hypothetical protein
MVHFPVGYFHLETYCCSNCSLLCLCKQLKYRLSDLASEVSISVELIVSYAYTPRENRVEHGYNVVKGTEYFVSL